MKHHSPRFTRRTVRAYAAALLSYLLLAGQVAPLALAAAPRAVTRNGAAAPPAEVAREGATAAPRLEAAAAPSSAAAFAPTITATKTDAYAGAPSAAPPGTTITYTITINNSGPDPATNLTLSDTIDPNTSFMGTPVASPIALDETYNVIGNVRIAPTAAQGLLVNDNNPNTGNNSGLTASGPTTPPTNGTATVAADGSFTYNPNAGFNGTDTFTYTVTSANGSDTATVTLKVGDGAGGTTGVIWFVNANAGTNGDGRLTNPFNCYTGAGCFSTAAADEAGDAIFLYDGAYTGGNTLLNNQKLVGQDASASLATLAGVTVPAYSDGLPATDSMTGGVQITTTVAATNAVTLGQGNTLRGFTIGNTTGADIFGNNFGTLTVGNSTTPDVILNGTGKALDLTTGTFAATSAIAGVTSTSSGTQGLSLAGVTGAAAFGSTTISGSTTQGILVGTTTADINFGNTSVTGGTDGVSFQNNSSGTRTFGTLTRSGGSGVGFLHSTGGGTVTVTGATSITNTTGSGIQISGSNATITFAATSVDKGANSGACVSISSNTEQTTTFSSLDLNSTNASGTGLLTLTNGGTINVTNAAGSEITAPVIIDSTGGAAFGLNFTQLASTNGPAPVPAIRVTGAVSGSLASATTNIQNPGNFGFNIDGTSANYNFGNTTVNGSAGTGVFLNNNTGTVTFADLDITPDANQTALHATNNTGTITSTSGDISITGGCAIDIAGASAAARTPLALVLTSVASTNSASASGGVNINFASGNLTVGAAGGSVDTNINNPNTFGIQVRNSGAGTLNFNDTNVSSSGGTGVVLGTASNGNTGAVTFNDLDIAPDNAQRAFHSQASIGQINVASGTFTTLGGATNVEIVGTSAASRTPLNMTLTQVGVGGTPTVGILLTNTSSPNAAGFTITGTGTTDGSGGSVANASQDAIRLTDVQGFVLKNFNIGDAAAANNEFPNTQVSITDDGIQITRVTPGSGGTYGFDADNVKIADTGNHGINGSNGATLSSNTGIEGGNVGLRFINGEIINPGDDLPGATESAFHFGSGFPDKDMISGTVTITSVTLSGFTGYGFAVENCGNGTLNMTVANSTIQNNDSTTVGNSGIHINIDGSNTANNAKANLTVNNTNFTNIDLDGIFFVVDPGATGQLHVNGGTYSMPNGDNAIQFTSGSRDTDDVEVATGLIENINVTSCRGNILQFSSGAGTYNLTVQNSTINSGNTTNGGGSHIGRAIDCNFDADHDPGGAGTTGDSMDINVKFDNVTTLNAGVDGIRINTNEVLPGSTFDGIITNNTFGTAANPVGRSDTGEGIEMIFQNMTANVLVQGNQTNTRGQTTTSEGIDIDAEAGSTVNATIVSNTINQALAPNANALDTNTEVAGTNICLDMRTNSASGGLGAQYQLANIAGATFNFEFPGAGAISAAEIQGAQTSGTASINSGTINKNGGANCPNAATPPLPTNGPVESTSDTGTPGGGPAFGGVVVAPSSSDGGNVTSRQFVSPMLRTKAQAAQPVVQQRGTAALKAVAIQSKAATQTKGETQGGNNTSGAPGTQLKKDATKTKSGTKNDGPVFNPPVINGDNLTWNIGTLPAGTSVTITFQVTIDNPFTGGSPQVSNQGTVTADGGVSVLTDDPDVAGANNPTITPVLATNIFARDGKEAEPPTGTAPLLFTIALSAPAVGAVTVNYSTADGGANPATGGASCAGNVDYVSVTNGSVAFAVGEQLRTVSVDICSDGPAEPDETFLLNLTGATGGTILDNQATGTITPAAPAGALLITELRTFGPGGSNDPADEFVELYNNSDAPLTVTASDASAGYGVYTMASGCTSLPLLLGTIPNGTIIPARGHYLLTGTAYSLANYGGTGNATGNLTLAGGGIPSNANVAVFSTSDITNLSTTTRLDAVGFGANTGGAICDLLREGATAPAVSNNLTMLGQYSVLRDPCGKGGNPNTFGTCPTTGNPRDSNSNASDFFMVDPNGTDAGSGQHIGAAGPENLASPIRRDATIAVSLIDGSVGAPAPPNRIRDFTSDPANNSTAGTLSIRRRFTNNTGGNVTRLRFRIVDISTFSSNNADLRARTSPASVSVQVNDAAVCSPNPAPCMINVLGTTLEEPPTQANGGGFNSTLAAGTITTGTPLANGASINLQFLLGIQQPGNFKFYFIIEALP